MSAIAIVQARMGSTRLPGKVLRDICGRPMLHHVLERTRACSLLDGIVVATTRLAEDTAIIDEAAALGVPAFVGSETDVLDRYYGAAREFGAEVVLRVTADCPVLDPALVEKAIARFAGEPELDYVGTGSTYPEGYGVEVFDLETLEATWREATLPSEREHVTPYIWKNRGRFAVERLELSVDASRFRLTVDRPVDLEVVTTLIRALAPTDPLFGVRAAIDYLRENPELAEKNMGIPRREGYLLSLKEERRGSSRARTDQS